MRPFSEYVLKVDGAKHSKAVRYDGQYRSIQNSLRSVDGE